MTKNNPAFRPQSRTLALEPRILFDGAAAIAVDQQAGAEHVPDAPQAAAEAPPHTLGAGSYTHLRAHETVLDLVCRLLLENKNTNTLNTSQD